MICEVNIFKWVTYEWVLDVILNESLGTFVFVDFSDLNLKP